MSVTAMLFVLAEGVIAGVAVDQVLHSKKPQRAEHRSGLFSPQASLHWNGNPHRLHPAAILP